MKQIIISYEHDTKCTIPLPGLKLLQDHENLILSSKQEQIIRYHLVPSEEAQVWCLSQGKGQIIAWLKRHKTTAKAQAELKSMKTWGKVLPCINIPQVIAHSASYLLLSHCAGQVSHVLSAQDLRQSAQFLASLHNLPWVDQDSLALSKALHQRSLSIFKQEENLKSTLQSQASLHVETFIELIKILREPVPISTNDQLNRRCPCHRDIRLEHLLFNHHHQDNVVLPSQKQSIRPTLSIIDWGQSRPDHWSSDWTKLCFESDQTPIIWQYYWQERLLSIRLSDQEKRLIPRMLRWALALHTLNTLKWAYLHQKPLLKTTQKLQDQTIIQDHSKTQDHIKSQVWKRALDELIQMNNFALSQFTL